MGNVKKKIMSRVRLIHNWLIFPPIFFIIQIRPQSDREHHHLCFHKDRR